MKNMKITSERKFDELDFAILAHLQNDGRKSFTDIAKELDIATNTVRNRVNRMVKENIMTIIARVHPYHAGFDAFADIRVSVEPSNLIETVASKISEFPEVSFVAMLSGEYDLILEVMCRDNQHLSEFVEKIHQIEGVSNTTTMIILKVFKFEQPDLRALSE
jgi:Lrp/AsnC family transcriptional regulator for asnA, asnC and gidA